MIDEQIEELSGLIDEEGAIVIVAKNLGVNLQSHQQAASMDEDQSIGKLSLKMNVSVVGRIINIEDIRNFNKKDGSLGVLLPFVIQDATGMIKDPHGDLIMQKWPKVQNLHKMKLFASLMDLLNKVELVNWNYMLEIEVHSSYNPTKWIEH